MYNVHKVLKNGAVIGCVCACMCTSVRASVCTVACVRGGEEGGGGQNHGKIGPNSVGKFKKLIK